MTQIAQHFHLKENYFKLNMPKKLSNWDLYA